MSKVKHPIHQFTSVSTELFMISSFFLHSLAIVVPFAVPILFRSKKQRKVCFYLYCTFIGFALLWVESEWEFILLLFRVLFAKWNLQTFIRICILKNRRRTGSFITFRTKALIILFASVWLKLKTMGALWRIYLMGRDCFLNGIKLTWIGFNLAYCSLFYIGLISHCLNKENPENHKDPTTSNFIVTLALVKI